MINVIGLGYIGLPTALMMASHGLEIVGTDYNEELVNKLNKGIVTFEEKGLKELFCDAVSCGIRFSCEYQKTNVYIVSVPTPYDKFSKVIDPSFVISAVESVLNVCEQETILVIESTISPGTIDRFIRPIIAKETEKSKKIIHLVHAPERIIPGNMVFELLNNNRTIGADNYSVGEKIASFYASFCKGTIVITDIKTAEMTKVVENTYRAINIAFANELTKICDKAGMDVYEVINICNMHPRVNILQPGPGVGGHCISVDPWFLVGDYPQLAKLISQAMYINDSMPEYVLGKISSIMKEKDLHDFSRVGLYGLTYKENVDDFRESPTLQLLESQEKHLANPLKVYDPWIKKDIVSNQYHDFDAFLKDIDILVIMVKHDHILKNLEKIKDKIVLDTCNVCKGLKTYRL